MMTSVRERSGLVLFFLAVLVGSAAAMRADEVERMLTPLTVTAVIAIVIGEQMPMQISQRVIAPLTMAPALGLILAPIHPGPHTLSASTVLAVVWLSILVGGLIARLRGSLVIEGSMGARLLGLAVTAVLARGVVIDGQNLVDKAFEAGTSPGLGAVGLLGAAVAGGLTERILENLMRLGDGKSPVAVVSAEIGPLAGISAASVSTGPVIAVASQVVDWAAIPLFLIPVLLTYISVRRVVGIRQAFDQSLLAMSHLSELNDLTRRGHARRVADLAVAIGREMNVDVMTLRDLESTALLHDVGQLGLDQPLRGGATIHASVAEQEQMMRATLQVIGDSPQLAPLIPLLDQVRTPFRQTREFGEHIPLTSRIVRVANAWDDITEGARSGPVRNVALERIQLGLGYDYDPEVVAALERVVAAS